MSIAIDPAFVNWSEEGSLEGRPLVLLLHGYGRDEHSLDQVGAALGDDVVTAALRGPRPSRDPFPGGNGWWDVDPEIIPLPGQDAETTEAVLAWLDGVIADRGAPSGLGALGFSQGAALSLNLLRYAPERWDAVVTLGGFSLFAPAPGDTRLAELKPAVFWGRTENDPAIRADYIAHTHDSLTGVVDLTERVYPGDEHAIVPDELADAVAFLRSRLLA